MAETEPRIITRTRKAKRETALREKIARDLWQRASNLLREEYSRTETKNPCITETFGEGEGTVEVAIKPEEQDEPNLYDHFPPAVIAIQIGVGPAIYLLPPGRSYGGRWEIPEGSILVELEELMGDIEERVTPKPERELS
jgi:hypothetical protein